MATQSQTAALPNQSIVTITRVYDAPRELVWKAWTDPKHLTQWWGPKSFSNPICEVDARPGGAIWIVMRGPKGTDNDNDFPMSGTFHEVVEPERLVFTAVAEDTDGNPLLTAHTTVTFEKAPGGKTKLTVHAEGKGIAPIAPQMLAGMEAGWTQSLEKLAELLARAG
jgi:uncharacterized protein YndB with AHSA1/START domain